MTDTASDVTVPAAVPAPSPAYDRARLLAWMAENDVAQTTPAMIQESGQSRNDAI